MREIGPKQAAEVLEMNYQRQRKLDERHVAFLANEMEQGRFMQGTKVHACTLPNRQQCLINGQHTVSAILKSGLPQLLTVQITRCKDEEEVAVCYAREDMNKIRTRRVVFNALDVEGVVGCGKNEAVLMGGAIELLVQKIGRQIQDRAMSSIELMDLIDKSSWRLKEFRKAKEGGRLQMSNGIMALALATSSAGTYNYDFWDGVAKDDGLRIGDPRKVFLSFLREKGSSVPQKPIKMTSAEALFRVGAYCFNRFAGRKQIKSISYPAAIKTDCLLYTEFGYGFTADTLHSFFSTKGEKTDE